MISLLAFVFPLSLQQQNCGGLRVHTTTPDNQGHVSVPMSTGCVSKCPRFVQRVPVLHPRKTAPSPRFFAAQVNWCAAGCSSTGRSSCKQNWQQIKFASQNAGMALFFGDGAAHRYHICTLRPATGEHLDPLKTPSPKNQCHPWFFFQLKLVGAQRDARRLVAPHAKTNWEQIKFALK